MENLEKELGGLIREAEANSVDDPEIRALITKARACIKNGDRAGCEQVLNDIRKYINAHKRTASYKK